MALDMCPCMPLQRGVELLAIIDAVLSVITVGLFLLALAIVGAMAFTEELGLSDGEKIVAVVAVLLVIAILAVQVFMAVQLYYGAKTKDYGKCRRWFVFTVIMLLLNFYGILKKGSDMDNVSFRLFLVELIYRFMNYLLSSRS
ncbi:hypothetical protein Ocin01_15656 [Orchesella cincta]|uniref:Uncharacterized protein n=1 Tax=Orchesella cincta TaxID=48709 RepID=A0A1D2MDD8_ORCCI|nr:hypothetical protein Ocin01_15656 [Orchesella cincta]